MTETTTARYSKVGEAFCPDCDNYVDTVQLLAQNPDDPDDWDVDDDAKPECKHCGSELLFRDEDEAAESAREDYAAERADAIRKGEW